MKELIQKLNDLKILQTSIDWLEDIPTNIYDEYIDSEYETLEDGVDLEKHRWYETSVTAFKLGNQIIGVRSVTDVFSESMDVSDCSEYLEFFEMKSVGKVTYVRV